jgi:ferrous iron transport protein B
MQKKGRHVVPKDKRGTVNVALVGNPNVGKSVIFNALTGARATVSNYPGTTVGVSRGVARIGDTSMEIVDTPGMYSLLPITEEEQVARAVLFDVRPDLAVNVVDARNLERMLVLTVQLIEAGLEIILVLNMMDEARAAGVSIDCTGLSEHFGLPVIPMVAVSGEGMDLLKEALRGRSPEIRGDA